MSRVRVHRCRVLFVVFCAGLLAALATAQEQPKAEVFGGYQHTQISSTGADGWNASFTGNVNRWFGVTADFSGVYKNFSGVGARAYTYAFGPTFSVRHGHVTPFAHVLLGGVHVSAGFESLSASTNGFATMIGGGVDVQAAKHVAIRVFQGDWIVWQVQGVTSKSSGRVSAGLVIRF